MAGNYVWPVDAVSGAPTFSARQGRQLSIAPFVAGATATRPLGARSGVRPGTPTSTVTATSTTWTVNPHVGVIDAEAAAQAGPYAYSFDQVQTGNMTAASGSYARIDLISVQISDPAESDGSSTPGATIVYTAGTAAAPALPPQPPRSMVIAQINVPISGGGSPSVTWVAPYFAAPSGAIPVRNDTERVALQPLATDECAILCRQADTLVFWSYTPTNGWRPVGKVPRGVWSLASATALASGTFVVAPIATAVGIVDSGMTNSGGAITLARAGVYEVEISTVWNGVGGNIRAIIPTLNCASISTAGVLSGGTSLRSHSQPPTGTYTDYVITTTVKFDAAANDVLRVFLFHDAGSPISLNTGGSTNFLGSTRLTLRQIG